ncbi:MAG TPA: EamA family transporter [Bacteroidota bacterium]|jgi:drug/metabolite transporter (DMT)-like permease|nr:EamA family transporter [Bacteroidota bacterium]
MNGVRPPGLRIFAAFAAIYVVWGSTYLAIRYAVESIPPFFMMGARSLAAGLILYAWSRFRGDERIQPGHWGALLILGTLFFLIGHGSLAWAQKWIPSGLAAVLVASQPLWIVTIESFFLRDSRVRWRGISGLVLGFGGVVYLISSTEGIDTAGGNVAASMAIIAGAISWSSGTVYARVAKLPKSPVLTAGMELIIGGVLLFIAGAMLGETNQLEVNNLLPRSLFGLGYLIIFGSVITFSAYLWLLGQTSATRISTHAYVNPILAVLLGWLVAGERLTVELLIAIIVVIVSVVLVLNDRLHATKV